MCIKVASKILKLKVFLNPLIQLTAQKANSGVMIIKRFKLVNELKKTF